MLRAPRVERRGKVCACVCVCVCVCMHVYMWGEGGEIAGSTLTPVGKQRAYRHATNKQHGLFVTTRYLAIPQPTPVDQITGVLARTTAHTGLGLLQKSRSLRET
jgi:hypothetical protein